jgi:hypothetical protein
MSPTRLTNPKLPAVSYSISRTAPFRRHRHLDRKSTLGLWEHVCVGTVRPLNTFTFVLHTPYTQVGGEEGGGGHKDNL